jgi:hypothetical protein
LTCQRRQPPQQQQHEKHFESLNLGNTVSWAVHDAWQCRWDKFYFQEQELCTNCDLFGLDWFKNK